MSRIFRTILRRSDNSSDNVKVDGQYLQQVEGAMNAFWNVISTHNASAIMLRLAWHDAASYDLIRGDGGPNGSTRFEEEYSNPVNAGLKRAIDLCEIVKQQYPDVTYADLFQLGAYVAFQILGGPMIPFVPGRTDLPKSVGECSRLPSPTGDANHLREVFNRMGFGNKEIVLISAALAMERKDLDVYGIPWFEKSWTLKNTYLKALNGKKLQRLTIDNVLRKDIAFEQLVKFYAKNRDSFYEDYYDTHKKFSEFGYVEVPVSEVWHQTIQTKLLCGVVVGAAAFILFSKCKSK